MPDFDKFLNGISQGVKKFYAPITDRVKAVNERRAQEGKPKSIKSNVPGDLEVTYGKDGYAINPHPLQTNAQGKIEMKPDYFTENSTILDEHVVDSKDPNTSIRNEVRNNKRSTRRKNTKADPKIPAKEQQLTKRDLKGTPKPLHHIQEKTENTYKEKFENPRHDLIEGDKNL